MLVFVLVLVLPLHYSNPVHDNEDNPAFAPIDTAIISYPHPFCEKLTLNQHLPNENYDVISTIYLLEKVPPLGRQDSATFKREFQLGSYEYEYWKAFLYPGSDISYWACSLYTVQWGKFYLVKGNRQFEQWKNGRSTQIHEEAIDAVCESDNSTFTFQVETEDNYHFIFQREGTSDVPLQVTFMINRFLFNTSDSEVISECSIYLNETKSCSLDVPLSSSYTSLLQLDTLQPMMEEWEASINLDVQCTARVWLYAVIAISTFIFLGGLILGSIFIYLCFNRRLKNTTRQVSNTPNEDTTLVDDIHTPPTYETYDTPPAYKPE